MLVRRLLIGLVLFLLILGAFSYGLLSGKFQLPPYRSIKKMADSEVGQQVALLLSRNSPSSGSEREIRLGRWGAAPKQSDSPVSEDLLAELDALGYVSGVQEAPAFTGVTRHDPKRAYGGLNLYNSGHDQVAVLMDMEGNVVHTWSFDIPASLDASLVKERDGKLARLETNTWRRVRLLEDGQLLAVFSGLGLVKLDKNSNPIWLSDLPIHHDLRVDEGTGRIFAIARERKIVPRFSSVRPILDDLIVVLNADGEVLHKVSLLEALDNSIYSRRLQTERFMEDIFHTNGIQLLDGQTSELKAFEEGNVLISIRHLDMVAAVNLERKSVVWALSDLWRQQHDPSLLDSGNLLVFDNIAGNDFSRVLELNPLTQEVVWAFAGSEEASFYSQTCGVAQRLGNGNTLITESDAGRAIEVTPDNEIVWEFYNPARAGEDGELIATLFEVRRLPSDFDQSWLIR